jgi:hypothetical protein
MVLEQLPALSAYRHYTGGCAAILCLAQFVVVFLLFRHNIAGGNYAGETP